MNARTPQLVPGLMTAGLILFLVFGALAALINEASDLDIALLWNDPYLRHITGFSFTQALLSTLLSIVPAIPVAYALSRRQFPGKALLMRIFAMTLVLPVLVAVFGLLAIYGNNGLLASALAQLGWQGSFSLYGLQGILLAHVFLNLPLATRLFVQSLEGIPFEQHQLSTHLGMSSWQTFRFVAWPRLRQQLPHAIGLVFMLCFTSFAVIMALGGGPKATTIELAIYQALRYDFDLAGGAILALWQMLLCCSLVLLSQRFAKPLATSSQSITNPRQSQFDSLASRCWDGCWIGLALLLVLPPLLSVVLAGLNSQTLDALRNPGLWLAVQHSLQIASIASVLALTGGTAILLTSRQWRLQHRRWQADGLDLIGTIILVTPGLVLSTGIFLLLRQFTDAFAAAFWVVIAVNALMALPYVLKTLSQPMLHVAQQYDPLCQSLGMRGLSRLMLVEWRALKKPFAQSLAIGFVLSLGDLGAIALFGSQDFQTLPLYLFQLLGSYQMDAAAVAALLLLTLSLGLFSLVERLITRTPSC
ncbi:thiamine/thiamine pyrophosphate ABC transporter permease ThiP [Photobacterium sp. DNB23_23_1]